MECTAAASYVRVLLGISFYADQVSFQVCIDDSFKILKFL